MRGLSLVSLLLPFKKRDTCVGVFVRERERDSNTHKCMQKLASALMYTLLFEHRLNPPVLLVPCGAAYDQS